MVLIDARFFPMAYDHIVEAARGTSSCATFLLVSPDVDAVCAAHLLHDLLRVDMVMNTVIPVANWPDMFALRERFEGEDVRSLIFINLGGMVDLLYYFSYLPPTCMMHVIDSHRPTNLANLFTPSAYAAAVFHPTRIAVKVRQSDLPLNELCVVVWGDAEGDEEAREAEKEAHLALLYEPESDSDTDSDDSDDDDLPPPRRRLESGESDEEEGDSPSNKRRKSEEPRPLTKLQRRRYRARTQKYYQSTFTGQSVASQVFVLASIKEKSSSDAVWLAILGLTHQFSTALVDRTRYNDYVDLLKDEVARQGGDVRPSEEMRLCLFRHSSLHDAMRHSGYIASKMKLWKERGLKNLDGMLAKMGYSILQSRENYAHMDTDLKSELMDNLKPLALEYGLDELTYDSFVKHEKYKVDISASDAVEGLGALLEVATGVRLDFGNKTFGGTTAVREEWSQGTKAWIYRDGNDKENTRPGNGAPVDNEEDEEEETERKAQAVATRNFWLAWDALRTDTSLLRSALPLAMALHRSVAEQGTYILDKSAIQTLRTYRMATISEGPYLEIFRHPATLLRLANWLVDAIRDLLNQGQAAGLQKTKTKSLPFVLSSFDTTTDRFLVVGIIGAVEFGDVKKNAFGVAFQNAAIRSRAQTRQSSFEASVIEVKKDDLPKFLKLLAIG